MTATPAPRDATTGTTEKVADAIRNGIRTGQFVPGQHLVEAELTLRLQISRSSLREALRHLNGDGIVAIHRYRGAHICRLSRRDTRDLLAVLEQLVRLAARLAAASTHEKRALMDAALDAARRHDEDGDHRSYIAIRQAFYDCLFEVAANRELPRVTPLRRADLFRAQMRPYQSWEQQQIHTAGYRRIAQAVVAGNVEAAEAAVQALFAETRAMVTALPDAAFEEG
ncbi:GntR family transcriptional regulator [Novosphingobium colocasiae]|uniref:GntR family transcriptional regulator n=1 Tax=Novosphingobium colocasiae TaxID=1256513 RepID=A0A918UD18_9SPHN|nr:GntR family transcriptional regulator [Novosphingobium colocasiae]GGY91806.1 GntR family transcriptional regulator [Novosphingobium colocasiae]